MLGETLGEYGYSHTKPTFFVKNEGGWYKVIHIHKFSFASSFRVHIALRHFYDEFRAIALNGPNSDSHREYKIDFSDDPDLIVKCVEEIKKFVLEIGFPWFEDILSLDEEKIFSKLKIEISNTKFSSEQTKKLLGIKD